MLTLQTLKELEPGIFAFGELPEDIKSIETGYTKFVAVRGRIHDWAIYKGPETWSWERIKTNGDKIFTKSYIKQLVPCTDEAFEMYRY